MRYNVTLWRSPDGRASKAGCRNEWHWFHLRTGSVPPIMMAKRCATGRDGKLRSEGRHKCRREKSRQDNVHVVSLLSRFYLAPPSASLVVPMLPPLPSPCPLSPPWAWLRPWALMPADNGAENAAGGSFPPSPPPPPLTPPLLRIPLPPERDGIQPIARGLHFRNKRTLDFTPRRWVMNPWAWKQSTQLSPVLILFFVTFPSQLSVVLFASLGARPWCRTTPKCQHDRSRWLLSNVNYSLRCNYAYP